MKKKKKNKIPLSIPFWNTYKRRKKTSSCIILLHTPIDCATTNRVCTFTNCRLVQSGTSWTRNRQKRRRRRAITEARGSEISTLIEEEEIKIKNKLLCSSLGNTNSPLCFIFLIFEGKKKKKRKWFILRLQQPCIVMGATKRTFSSLSFCH